MNENKKSIEYDNGWILCPSKSFPGKLYYFNVLTGETAWSLNQPDNKNVRNENVGAVHKIVNKSHRYPEPTMLPDETTSATNNIYPNISIPNFQANIPTTKQMPTFGQATFPNYVANVEHSIPNIVWTSVPIPVFCPDTIIPMFDKVTQIREYERELPFTTHTSQSSNTPLNQRFKGFKKSFVNDNRRNNIVKPSAFEASTLKNSFQSGFWKWEPDLKLVPPLPNPNIPDVIKNNEKPLVYPGTRFEDTKSSTDVPKTIESLQSTDLRLRLLAKRKSMDVADAAVENKKLKPSESKPKTPKKKITFLENVETDVGTDNDLIKQKKFIPLSLNFTRTTIQVPRSQTVPKETYEIPKTFPLNVNAQQPIYQPPTNSQPPTNQRPPFNTFVWYLVVDTDVLLLDCELIDKIVLSDPICRLVIPQAVAADIEALCLGDCRGQQRIINARQLTRKLATPPPHYIVDSQTLQIGDVPVTNDCIIDCCMKGVNKNYYVVLITNDPHLRSKAIQQNIPSYNLNELKNGVDIKPNFSSEQRQTKINILNDDITGKTEVNKNINLFSNLNIKQGMTSEVKPMRLTSNDDVNGKNQCNDNLSWYRYKSPVEKQLFLSSGSGTDSSLDCDKLRNTNKPKSLINIDNINQFDTDVISDISSEVLSLKIKDKNVMNTQPVPRNPFQNVKENAYVNFEKRIQNPNVAFKTYSIGNSYQNVKPVIKTNNDTSDFHKDFLENNFENPDRLFCSIPITNLNGKPFESRSTIKKSIQPDMSDACRQEPFEATEDSQVLNPSQMNIKKKITTINNDPRTKTQIDSQINKTKDSTGIFKIPLLPIKNGTRNASVPVGNSNVTDKIGTSTNIDVLDENLIRYRIKSKSMKEKLKTRIDEWTCSYMQIMEDVLHNILQSNSVCMKNTAAPVSLRDTFNCIKMLYNTHTKVRDFINKLTKLLDKSRVFMDGKLKIRFEPEDFMKLFGYGVLLVISLKDILPQNEELKEAELRLNALLNNLESNAEDLDPEVVKSLESRSEVDIDQEEIRPHFIKKTSYVVDYLKKHYKKWEKGSINIEKEDLVDHINHKIENHTEFKVVRTLGKNLNKFKIDRKKTISVTNKALNEDSANKVKDGPKLIRLLEDNQLTKPNNTESLVKHVTTRQDPRLKRLSQNEFNHKANDVITDQNNDVSLKRVIENVQQEQNNASILKEDFNYTSPENTLLGNSVTEKPRIISNVKSITDIENKNKKRGLLDLDLLDYSEIYEPSVNENPEFDIISEKNKNSVETDQNNKLQDVNYGLGDFALCTLEDFYVTPSNSPDSKSNECTFDNKNTENSNSNNITSDNFNSVSENNTTNVHIQVKTERYDCEVESIAYTENLESHNDSCIANDNTDGHIENSETHDNYDKAGLISTDGSTNDSGFENDSIHAHSLIKIFLNELSSTFKVVHTFVNNFVKEIRENELSYERKSVLHTQASRSLEDMVAIINKLRFIVRRESAEDTILKILLRRAGVEATTDKRITRYRQLVIKCLEQAQILESALKIVASTTKGDFKSLSTLPGTMNPSIRYFNIFE